jgi:hypothetical protein
MRANPMLAVCLRDESGDVRLLMRSRELRSQVGARQDSRRHDNNSA